MRTTFFGFELARRALAAQQRALDVTGQNIANANTEGYSRQRVALQASPPLQMPAGQAGQLGTGVEVARIQRVRDAFLDQQYRQQAAQQEDWKTREGLFNQIQSFFNEPSDNGLQAVLDRYWTAWQGLADNPESLAARESVVQQGLTLADTFHQLDRQLADLQGNLDDSILDKVAEVNALAAQVADLNGQIRRVEVTGQQANDLRDRRDQLLDQLARLAGARVRQATDGTVRVSIGGVALVDGEKARALGSVLTASGHQQPVWPDLGNLAVDGLDGEIAAYLQLRDGPVQAYRDQLAQLADALAQATNTLHKAYFDLNGNPGQAFFVPDPSAPTASWLQAFTVNPALLSDPNLVAAATTSGAPGDGTGALDIAALRSQPNPALGGSAPDDFYRSLVADLGVRAQEAQRTRENQDVLVLQLSQQRQAVSGVSLDEEMTNMLRYQDAYQAAARLVTALDEMLDTVIERMGLAGR